MNLVRGRTDSVSDKNGQGYSLISTPPQPPLFNLLEPQIHISPPLSECCTFYSSKILEQQNTSRSIKTSCVCGPQLKKENKTFQISPLENKENLNLLRKQIIKRIFQNKLYNLDIIIGNGVTYLSFIMFTINIYPLQVIFNNLEAF